MGGEGCRSDSVGSSHGFGGSTQRLSTGSPPGFFAGLGIRRLPFPLLRRRLRQHVENRPAQGERGGCGTYTCSSPADFPADPPFSAHSTCASTAF